MNRAPRVLAGLAVLAAVVLGVAGPALAHVALVSSTPGDGARLTSFPSQVVLEFNQEVEPPAYAIVTGPGGADLRAGDPVVDGPRVVVPTRSSRADGAYTIAYRVVSADGHPISGQLTATVGVVGADPADAAAPRGESGSVPEPRAAPPADVAPAASDGSGSNRTAVASSVGVALFALSGLLAVLAHRTRPSNARPHPTDPNPLTRRNP